MAAGVHDLPLAVLLSVHVAHVQLLDRLLVAHNRLAAALGARILDDTVRLRPVKHQLRALDMGTGEGAVLAATRGPAIRLLVAHRVPVVVDFAAEVAFGGVLLANLVAIVLDRAALVLVGGRVPGGLTADLTVMFGHAALGDVTLGGGEVEVEGGAQNEQSGVELEFCHVGWGDWMDGLNRSQG